MTEDLQKVLLQNPFEANNRMITVMSSVQHDGAFSVCLYYVTKTCMQLYKMSFFYCIELDDHLDYGYV